ncbi:MAG: FAD-binding oxidoreductase [Flavobacteriales bacterium]|nr:FAD-binding oxidoreductase [Flavobacteriales bacterium]
MNKLYTLNITEINTLTSDSVEIKFGIPSDISSKFKFKAGQYITIKHNINGEEIRRSYSLCSDPNTNEIAVGVKRVEGGKMSTFLTKEIKIGDALEVIPPTGNFVFEEGNVVAICAGSGITPILSMMKSSNSLFTLIYGNKTVESTMFYDEIRDINSDNHFVFSREEVGGCSHSRINNSVIETVLQGDYKDRVFYICGPGELIENTQKFLIKNGVKNSDIFFEMFTSVKKKDAVNKSETNEKICNITVIMDGDEFEYKLSSIGDTILDSAMEEGADIPFSCKGAVCCTCKAKVMEGKAIMDENYSLSEEEVEEGYILTCQAHPTTENIIVDFDEM